MGLLRFLANRFKEPSSWAGLAPLLAGAGLSVPGGVVQGIILVGAGTCTLLAILLPEKK